MKMHRFRERPPRYVVDEQGQKTAVILDYEVWQELLALLEDLEDIAEIRELQESGEEAIPWEEAKEALRREGVDV